MIRSVWNKQVSGCLCFCVVSVRVLTVFLVADVLLCVFVHCFVPMLCFVQVKSTSVEKYLLFGSNT